MDVSLSSVTQRLPTGREQPVELRPGQVVQGRVLRVLPDDMAVVQIGGTQVIARLEATLEPGQKAWLAVQPDAHPLTLKVLAVGSGDGGEPAWELLLRSLGADVGKEARLVAEALVKQGLPVDKETVAAFLAISGKHGATDGIVDAFVLAARRNLPLTENTVMALNAFFSDRPLTEAIRALLSEANAYLGAPEHAGSAPDGTAEALRQTVALLRDAADQLLSSVLAEDGEAADGPPPAAAVPPSPGPAGMTRSSGAEQPPALGPTGHLSAEASAASGPAQTGGSVPHDGPLPSPASSTGLAGQASTGAAEQPYSDARTVPDLSRGSRERFTVAPSEAGETRELSDSTLPPAPPRGEAAAAESRVGAGLPERMESRSSSHAAPVEPKAAGEGGTRAPADVSPVPSDDRRPGEGTADGARDGGQLVRAWLHRLGVAHERQAAARALAGTSLPAAADSAENVKSLLLKLVQAPSHALPAGLRESAEALLHQITGQQLMLSPPPADPLTHLVLQIPLRNGDGAETAYVQVEAQRRDGKQLDPDNCRLYFCLVLDKLGPTAVDVRIVNRIVNVTLGNDQPWVESLASGLREGFAEQLRAVGYHLSALKCQPLPQEASRPPAESAKARVMTEYRGVDLRI